MKTEGTTLSVSARHEEPGRCQQFEEKFSQAKQENQSLLTRVATLIDDTSQMLEQSAKQRAANKHYIEYELTDPETLDSLLTQAEQMLESILSIREFSQLKDLE